MMFSIVVPVYNSEEYLAKCVDSVREQSFRDWELILVNDGSTDNTKAIMEQYAQEDNRICTVHQSNKGQLFARRNGMAQAKGEYLLFMDSDDYWHPECLSRLNAVILEYAPDLVMFTAQRIGITRDETERIGNIGEEAKWVDKTFFYNALISGVTLNSLWNKAFKRTLFADDTTDYAGFAGVCWGEDRAQLLHPVTKAEKIYYIPDALYYYVDNPTSVLHVIQVDRIPQMISNPMFCLLYEYMQKWEMDTPEDRETVAVQYLRNYTNAYYRMRNSCKTRADRKAYRRYPWKKVVSGQAFGYKFSKKLNFREKLKLILARYGKV